MRKLFFGLGLPRLHSKKLLELNENVVGLALFTVVGLLLLDCRELLLGKKHSPTFLNYVTQDHVIKGIKAKNFGKCLVVSLTTCLRC